MNQTDIAKEDRTIGGIYPILDDHWMTAMGLYDPSNPETHRRMIEIARLLAELAIDQVQLRSKETPRRAHAFMAHWLPILREHAPRVAVLINDRPDLALALAADGLHVGEDDLPLPVCRRLLGNRAIIGLSTHSVDAVRRAQSGEADYLGFGPIFTPGAKDDAEPVQGLVPLGEAGAISHKPIIAIGGIDGTGLRRVAGSGAAGAAMISGLWGVTDGKGWRERLTAAVRLWRQSASS